MSMNSQIIQVVQEAYSDVCKERLKSSLSAEDLIRVGQILGLKISKQQAWEAYVVACGGHKTKGQGEFSIQLLAQWFQMSAPLLQSAKINAPSQQGESGANLRGLESREELTSRQKHTRNQQAQQDAYNSQQQSIQNSQLRSYMRNQSKRSYMSHSQERPFKGTGVKKNALPPRNQNYILDSSQSNRSGNASFFNKRNMHYQSYTGRNHSYNIPEEVHPYDQNHQQASVSEANLHRQVEEAARTIKKYPSLKRKANDNINRFAEQREYMSAQFGLSGARAARQRIRDQLKQQKLNEEQGIDFLVRNEKNALHAINIYQLLTSGWTEEKDAYKIRSQISKKQQNRIRDISCDDRYH